METRQITQVKVYVLRLNSIFANAEQANIVLVSPELSHLQDYYFKNRCAPYHKMDEAFGINDIRNFAESSHLVDYNPADYEVQQCCTYDGAHGLLEEWVNIEDLDDIKNAHSREWLD